jgi:hypothetical protein
MLDLANGRGSMYRYDLCAVFSYFKAKYRFNLCASNSDRGQAAMTPHGAQ